jgi:hypothetical protein
MITPRTNTIGETLSKHEEHEDCPPVGSAQHAAVTRLSDLREAAHAGYMAACRDVYALVEETRKTSNITDDFTRGRCFEAKGIARTMGALGTESDELRKALGEVMRAAIARTTGANQ